MIDHRINRHLTTALALGVGVSASVHADAVPMEQLALNYEKVVDQSGAAIPVPIRIKHGL